MKKIALYLFGALALAACNNGYNIDVTTNSNNEGDIAYLVDYNTNETIDSCIIKNNTIKFNGNTTEPGVFRIQINHYNKEFLVEPGSNISIDLTGKHVKITDNGGLNDKAAQLEEEINKRGAEFQIIYNQVVEKVKAGEISEDKLDILGNNIIKELNNMHKVNIIDNKDNILGAYLFATKGKKACSDLALFDSIKQALKYSDKITVIDVIREELERIDQTKEGKMFVDFKGKDIDGNDCNLSDYVGKGKYVVADFWASWCSPCREEIPNLIAISKEFGNNLVVLGINVWDNEKAFKEAVASENIKYPQIYLPKNNDDASYAYNIKGIPHIILFGPDGTILKRNLRGEGIKKAIEEAMNK
ncbi:MAG: AhpC/TSA family protein [Bacteroidaceae bacterium]|nr:AhpC/TSA family protein [Bacteroidaceae bacterium]